MNTKMASARIVRDPRWTLLSRILMAITPIIFGPIFGVIAAAYTSQANNIKSLSDAQIALAERVTVIETRINIGQDRRSQFEQTITNSVESLRSDFSESIDKVTAQNIQLLQSVAAIVARLDAQDRVRQGALDSVPAIPTRGVQ